MPRSCRTPSRPSHRLIKYSQEAITMDQTSKGVMWTRIWTMACMQETSHCRVSVVVSSQVRWKRRTLHCVSRSLYARDVHKLLCESNGRGYFVIGFDTAGMTWIHTCSRYRAAGVNVSVPVSKLATGLPTATNVEVGMGAGCESGNNMNNQLMNLEEVIFSVP